MILAQINVRNQDIFEDKKKYYNFNFYEGNTDNDLEDADCLSYIEESDIIIKRNIYD